MREKTMQAVFFLTACVSIVSVVLICLFLFANGIPAMGEIGALNFLLGKEWRPGNGMFGIFPMILGSIAGDNTIMCAVRTVDDTIILMDKLKKIINE